MKKLFALVGVIGTSWLVAGPVTNYNSLKDWTFPKYYQKYISENNGAIKFNGKYYFTVISKKIDVKPGKKYQVSAKLQALPGTKKNYVWFGVKGYDAQGRGITSETINFTAKNFTQLAAPAKKGDTSVLLKDCAKWNLARFNAKTWERLAFNAKADLSDLPNFDYSERITSIVKEGNNYRVKFAKPLTKNYAAGTNVRNHRSGASYLYIYSSAVPQTSANINQVFQGDAGKAGQARGKFWTATKSISLVMLVSQGVNCQFSDMKVTEL